MKTTTRTHENILDNVNVNDEVAKSGVSLIAGAGALIGLWAVACLMGGIASSGIGGVIKGYLTAVIGG